MDQYEVFSHAPITEALLDIRVLHGEGTSSDAIKPFTSAIADQFPNTKPRITYSSGFEIKAGQPPAHIEQKVISAGTLHISVAGDKVVQARTDGFSFSQLKPYKDWGTLRDEAKTLWELYCEVLPPIKVTRLALRYINRIELPMPVTDFKDYILTGPEIAPKLPQGISEFFFRVVIPDPERRASAIVISTIDKTDATKNVLPLIFDIDVARQEDFQPDGQNIWDIFDSLRILKNDIFFGSVTEKAKELFR